MTGGPVNDPRYPVVVTEAIAAAGVVFVVRPGTAPSTAGASTARPAPVIAQPVIATAAVGARTTSIAPPAAMAPQACTMRPGETGQDPVAEQAGQGHGDGEQGVARGGQRGWHVVLGAQIDRRPVGGAAVHQEYAECRHPEQQQAPVRPDQDRGPGASRAAGQRTT